jgi:hypothetical protein
LYIRTDWNLIREPLRASGLKEGAVVAVGEKLPQKKIKPQEDETKWSAWKKKRQYTCRLFEMNSLKEGAM